MFGKKFERALTASFIFILCSGMFIGMAAADPGDGRITHNLELRQGSPCLVFHGEVQTPSSCWVAIRASGAERVVTTGEREEAGEFLVVYPDIEAGDVYTFGIGTGENRFEYYGPYEVTITETDLRIAESGLE